MIRDETEVGLTLTSKLNTAHYENENMTMQQSFFSICVCVQLTSISQVEELGPLDLTY